MATQLLKNAYDIHVHASPDVIPRATGQKDLALTALEAGMSGILLKDGIVHLPLAAPML